MNEELKSIKINDLDCEKEFELDDILAFEPDFDFTKELEACQCLCGLQAGSGSGGGGSIIGIK